MISPSPILNTLDNTDTKLNKWGKWSSINKSESKADPN